MAKYTMLFSEWLEAGGQMPARFSDISNFENEFKAYYADKEIGFETPELFELKLNAYAELYIPPYSKRLAAFEKALSGLENPQKVRERTGGIEREYGERTGAATDLPDTTPATAADGDLDGFYSPNTVRTDKAYTDKENYMNIKDIESGDTVSEAIERVKMLTGQVRIIREELLREFKNLFMQVY